MMQAFEQLDENGDGALTVDDMSSRYDASVHPDVVAGSHTEVDVASNFVSCFDGSLGPKSAIVTPEKFVTFHSNMSATIDSDDYFELVVRNVWHLNGGEGQFENTSCRRLLVTHDDGSQTVEEIGRDFDVSADDLKARCFLLHVPLKSSRNQVYFDPAGFGALGTLVVGRHTLRARAAAACS
jgi:hypothetical protein